MVKAFELRKYIETGGTHCVYCGAYGKNVVKQSNKDSSLIEIMVKCDSCKKSWTDRFSLTGTDIEPDSPDGKDAIAFLTALGVAKDCLDGEHIGISGVDLYKVEVGLDFEITETFDQLSPVYEPAYVDSYSDNDVSAIVFNFNNAWIVIDSVWSYPRERDRKYVMVAKYSESDLRSLVAHFMNEQIRLPATCRDFPGLLKEVVSQRLD